MSRLAKSIHVALQKVALEVAGSIRKSKELKKGFKDDTLDFFDSISCAVDSSGVDRSKADKVLVVAASTLKDLCDCGPPVRQALESNALLNVKLEPGTHITECKDFSCFKSKALAEYEASSAKLRIAVDIKIRASTAPKVGQGEHNVGRDFRTVLSHEVGHIVMDRVEQTARKKFRIVYDLHPQEFWEDNVSEYAGKNDHELFAECFAAYTSSLYRGNLPQDVVDFFESAGLMPMVRKAGRKGGSSADKSVDAADWSVVGDAASAGLEKAYIESYGDEAKFAGLDMEIEVVNEAAARYAEDRAAQLIQDISDTTRDSLRDSVSSAIKDGQTSSQFADTLVDSYDFSEARAETIARTELAMANVQAHVDASSAAGAVGKRWLLGDDHDDNSPCDCTDNAEEDVIAFDEDWASGDDWPPSHPNCTCDFEAVYADDPDAADLIDEEEESAED